MNIGVDAIAEGRRVDFGLEDTWAAAAAREVLEVEATELTGALQLSTTDDVIHVAGQVRVVGQRECERCGEAFALALEAPIELDYLPADTTPEHGETELGADELDVGWYEGGRLSLRDVLSEAIALAMPNRVACPDQAACDARTERLLAERGAQMTGHPGLQALKKALE